MLFCGILISRLSYLDILGGFLISWISDLYPKPKISGFKVHRHSSLKPLAISKSLNRSTTIMAALYILVGVLFLYDALSNNKVIAVRSGSEIISNLSLRHSASLVTISFKGGNISSKINSTSTHCRTTKCDDFILVTICRSKLNFLRDRGIWINN